MIVVDTVRSQLIFGDRAMPAIFGKGGAIAADQKREGDGASPIGKWRLRTALFRPDRGLMPKTGLPWRWLRESDGWCDASADPQYNRPVTHPYRSSAERLWRDDNVYDIIIVLNHNLEPVVPGAGSAIFWHLTQPDRRPTEGCIAIGREHMLSLLPDLHVDMQFEIR